LATILHQYQPSFLTNIIIIINHYQPTKSSIIIISHYVGNHINQLKGLLLPRYLVYDDVYPPAIKLALLENPPHNFPAVYT